MQNFFIDCRREGKMEKVYKTMKGAGVGNIVIGISILLTGMAAGILLIISGSALMRQKRKLTF
mgnify:CR=1 FL=1